MPRIIITTTARADIRETWTYDVTDEVAATLVAEPYRALDLLADNEIAGTLVDVTDEVVGNEEDREVEEVKEVS